MLIATLVFVTAALLPAATLLPAAALVKHVDVFTSGQEGYASFRIPAVQATPDGSLLALAEGRKYSAADPGFDDNDVDLVYKRSTDGGETWSKLHVLDDPGERWSACNPVTVVDRTNRRIWVLHCRQRPGRSSTTSRAGTDDSQAWAHSSDDDGQSWSEPIEITAAARDVERWGGSFFGPGGAIQSRTGRLIVPLSRTTGRRNAKGQQVGGSWSSFAIYSDDHGRSWKRGALLPGPDRGNENQLVELADGRILVDVRQNAGAHRWLATSADGGETWSAPRPGQSLTRVACAIERYTLRSQGDDRDRILWTGPKGPGRSELVVRTSYDEGKTFGSERLISKDKAAYSDMTILKGGTVGVLWERGDYRWITLSRFDRRFLEPAATADPERPDGR